ncbi:MAG: rhodanese-like domain-containing protein [Acidobacteriota bacterium]|nr:rhodanese-like domain-containing protein [Acidobacteriota bacterium]
MSGLRQVTVTELDARMRQGLILRLLDVRSQREYQRGHATPATLLPLDQLDAASVDQHRSSDGNLYVICQAGTRSAEACRRLQTAGVPRVVNVAGGTTAWQRAGLPVAPQRRVIAMERQVRIGAGMLVVLGCALSWLVKPALLVLAALVGCGLIFAGVTDICGLAMLLARMPWNRGATTTCATTTQPGNGPVVNA